jgi:hypothetical protein
MSFTAAWAIARPFVLPVLLLASAGYNVLQWRDAAVDAAVAVAERSGEIATAEERGRRLVAERHAFQADQLVGLAQADALDQAQRLRAIVADADSRLGRYHDTVSLLPLPPCAPGRERQDAVNALLQGPSS